MNPDFPDLPKDFCWLATALQFTCQPEQSSCKIIVEVSHDRLNSNTAVVWSQPASAASAKQMEIIDRNDNRGQKLVYDSEIKDCVPALYDLRLVLFRLITKKWMSSFSTLLSVFQTGLNLKYWFARTPTVLTHSRPIFYADIQWLHPSLLFQGRCIERSLPWELRAVHERWW